MKIVNVYGEGRRDTLLALLAALRAGRKGKSEVQVGPMEERLLSAYGVFLAGDEEDVDALVEAMRREAKRLGIKIEPAEFMGEID